MIINIPEVCQHGSFLTIRKPDEHIRAVGETRFGFEEPDESAKAERVRRHFNSVADRYDMMNAGLSESM